MFCFSLSLFIEYYWLVRSAISIVEEDKRCFACPTIPDSDVSSHCIVPCHYNQRCYLKASHANSARNEKNFNDLPHWSLLLLLFLLQLRIVVVQKNDGFEIYLLMVVWHMKIIIGACVQLIYAIPVILHLFVVCRKSIFFHLNLDFISGYDDCSNDPCPSGTVCLDTRDGFSCICPPWQDECTYGRQDTMNSRSLILIFYSFKCWLFL